MHKGIACAAVVVAVLVGGCLLPAATRASTRPGAPAKVPTMLWGAGKGTLVSSKTTSTVQANGVTLISQTVVFKYSGVVNGTVHEMQVISTYPDGHSLVSGTDSCDCTAMGLTGMFADQYNMTDNGKTFVCTATLGPGSGGFAGVHGWGTCKGSDADPNHFTVFFNAEVP